MPDVLRSENAMAIERVILADDDEFFRIALSSILKKSFGIAAVDETSSFDDAIERLSQPGVARRSTLAIFDLTMPGMAGASSLAAVRECYGDVIVVVVSASARRSDILQALAAGVHGYVPKRLGVQELCRAFAHILSGEVYVPVSLARLDEPAPRAEAHFDAAAFAGGDRNVDLTPRQTQALALLVEGCSNKEMARRLSLGEGTIKVHVASLLRLLDVPNRVAAAAIGAKLLTKNRAP